ncbi:hypothetical protein Q5752_003814 [Cryptotrichosporon argae]
MSVPFHRLPLASSTLQSSLPQLALAPNAVAPRKSTTFPASTAGVWARVEPLWAEWPPRITRDEADAFGIEDGGGVSADKVLGRWAAVDVVHRGEGGALDARTSAHRSKQAATLLGVSSAAAAACLPHLDLGDAASPDADKADDARDSLTDVLGGRHVLASDSYGPWSTRYCGHQFGIWAGQLGDGRAISLLETESENGRCEVQVKGAGRTPFSRSADGLAVLRSGVREYLGCEAIAALGIPTTRALALLTSPVSVLRENGPEPSSLLARLAPSFIRIGHFEALNPGEAGRNNHMFFLGASGWGDDAENDGDGPLGGQGSLDGLRRLAVWCMGITGHTSVKDWALDVVQRNAEMVGAWQVVGFMHGVLNTDNISVLGLTIDYGPYAFMDVWDENHICNHSDPTGLYAYRAQPGRVLFALNSFIRAVSPLVGHEAAHGALPTTFSDNVSADDVREWEARAGEALGEWEKGFWAVERETEGKGWRRRLGLKTHQDADDRLVADFLTHLHTHGLDLNASVRALCAFPADGDGEAFAAKLVAAASTSAPPAPAAADLARWLKAYAARVAEPGEWGAQREAEMKRANPRFVLRQWVLEEVIATMEAALADGDVPRARQVLAEVLEMALNPFNEYDGERARWCGLGARDMLGFQCSCSS